MRCSVGIDCAQPEWIIILSQIGIPWIITNLQEKISIEDTPVLILTNLKSCKHVKSNIISFLKSGGSLLTTASCAESIFEIPTKKARIQYLLPDDRLLYHEFADVNRHHIISKNSNCVPNQNNRFCIQASNYLNGKLVVLPDCFVQNILNRKNKRKNFYAEGGLRFPSENVSNVSKGTFSRIIKNALIELFHHHTIPFVSLSCASLNASQFFIFRIDTDYSSLSQIEFLYNILEKHQFKATWFLEAKTQSGLLQAYHQFVNHELAYHCFRHRIFRFNHLNLRDFKTGLKILKHNKIEPKGYAAPYGSWTPALSRLIDQFGFEYSSEFSNGYDCPPYYPYINGQFMKALQLPIHPISTGRLTNARFTEKEMINYYINRLNYQLNIDEPVVFYHHPVHERFEVFDEIFSVLKALSIKNLTMLEYARWWKNRNAISWTASYEQGNLIIHTDYSGDDFFLNVLLPDKSIYRIPLNQVSYSIDTLNAYRKEIVNRTLITPSHATVKSLRQFDSRLIKQSIISNYRRMKQ